MEKFCVYAMKILVIMSLLVFLMSCIKKDNKKINTAVTMYKELPSVVNKEEKKQQIL